MKANRKIDRFPSVLPQAAALPWRQADGVEVMLITSLGTGRWVLPKGGLMPGEPARTAAGREALEEAGLEGILDLRPLGTYSYDKQTAGGWMQPCSVTVYPLKFALQRKTWRERDRRKTKWFSCVEAAEAVREDDLRRMILAFNPIR
jgi:8-oxo-dGTP pyrophosphatase MutT (NUDIX family)